MLPNLGGKNYGSRVEMWVRLFRSPRGLRVRPGLQDGPPVLEAAGADGRGVREARGPRDAEVRHLRGKRARPTAHRERQILRSFGRLFLFCIEADFCK